MNADAWLEQYEQRRVDSLTASSGAVRYALGMQTVSKPGVVVQRDHAYCTMCEERTLDVCSRKLYGKSGTACNTAQKRWGRARAKEAVRP